MAVSTLGSGHSQQKCQHAQRQSAFQAYLQGHQRPLAFPPRSRAWGVRLAGAQRQPPASARSQASPNPHPTATRVPAPAPELPRWSSLACSDALFILRSLKEDPREDTGSAPAGVAGGLWMSPGSVPGPAAELGKGGCLDSGQRTQPGEGGQRRGGQEGIGRGGGRLGALQRRRSGAWERNWSPGLRPGEGGGRVRQGETGGWS